MSPFRVLFFSRRRFVSACAVLFLFAGLFLLPACGKNAKTSSDDNVIFGSIRLLPEEEHCLLAKTMGAARRALYEADSLQELLLALRSNRVQYIVVPSRYSAQYIVANNPDLTMAVDTIKQDFVMVLDKNSALLRSRINEAVKDMEADGSLRNLKRLWLENPKPGQQPPAPEPAPLASGPERVRFGVCGDVPPVDFVSADGKPAGFNVAFLQAVATRIGANPEFVPIEASARLTALKTGRVDVIFWMRTFNGPVPEEGILVTQPYFSDSPAFITREYPMEKIRERHGLPDESAEKEPAASEKATPVAHAESADGADA